MILNSEIMEIKRKLDEHEKRIFELESLIKAKPIPVKKRLSIRELIRSKKPKSNVQKTLLVAYFLEKYESFISFNVKDLEEGFRSAKEKVPSNINMFVNQNIKQGYMMEFSEKKDNLKAWTLTNTGEDYVDNDFKKEE